MGHADPALAAAIDGSAFAVLLAGGVLGLLSIVVGCVLGWASRRFHVEVDPRVERVLGALPGANCGGCGYVGCGEYAEAVVAGAAAPDLCGPGGVGCAQAVAGILGIDLKPTFPYRAVVHCSATTRQRLKRSVYRGEPTCSAANLVAGVQGCVYGCLGFGDCVRACDYDAIHIADGLAVVDYDRCVGCRACALVCPRNIISMVPFKADRMLVVACSNQDLGPDVKEVCETGCIGCKACARGNDFLVMRGNVPEIDYERYDPDRDFLPILEKCRMESLVFAGRPTRRDLEETADEELPDRIEADFRTTVDETDWWG